MNVKVVGNNVIITTVVSLEELKELNKRKPEALVLTEKNGDKVKEIFRVGVGESSLSAYGAAFSGNTNTEPKLAMMTLDISSKPAEMGRQGVHRRHLRRRYPEVELCGGAVVAIEKNV